VATFDYVKSRQTANRLITKFGMQTCKLLEVVEGVDADPWDDSSVVLPDNFTEHTITAVVIDYEDEEVNDTSILRQDKKALISAEDIPAIPNTSMVFVTTDGEYHSIVNVKPLKPADIAVMYEVQIRVK
jgi:hypothetical protein